MNKITAKNLDRTYPPGLVLLFLVYGAVSVSMTLVNKTVSEKFPFAFTTVLLQNIGALGCSFFLVVTGLEKMYVPNLKKHLLPSSVNTMWMVLTFWASLKALHYISVPLYIVSANARPLCTALFEYVWLRRPIQTGGLLGLGLIVLGAYMYGVEDSSSASHGFVYALINTLLVTSLAVYEKWLATYMQGEQTPVGINAYRIALSLPCLVLLISYQEGWGGLSSLVPLSFTFNLLLISSVLAMLMGVFMFTLQLRVSATTIQLANTMYKFLTTFISLFTHPIPRPVPLIGWVGYALSSIGFLFYSGNAAKGYGTVASKSRPPPETSSPTDKKPAGKRLRKKVVK